MEVYNYLLSNSQPVKWQGFHGNKTPFGTVVDPKREDVLVAMVEEKREISQAEAQLERIEAEQHFLAAFPEGEEVDPGFKDQTTQVTLSMVLVIPEEFDNYQLVMFREKHVPVLRKIK